MPFSKSRTELRNFPKLSALTRMGPTGPLEKQFYERALLMGDSTEADSRICGTERNGRPPSFQDDLREEDWEIEDAERGGK